MATHKRLRRGAALAVALVLAGLLAGCSTGRLYFPGLNGSGTIGSESSHAPDLRSGASGRLARCAAPSSADNAPAPEPRLAQDITYVPAAGAISGLVTKFGGQPTWLGDPQWPIGKTTGTQMTFIGQIVIDKEQFPNSKATMAYLFMSDDFDYDVQPWDPEAGDNAVVLQPGGKLSTLFVPKATGPAVLSLYPRTKGPQKGMNTIEFGVKLKAHQDAAAPPEATLDAMSEAEWAAYETPLDPDKIGGTPVFIQGSEFPGCGVNKLLWQVAYAPIYINLGDGGSGYVYLNDSGTVGKFLSQSH